MINLKKNFQIDNALIINFINLSGKEKELVRSWRNNNNVKKWMYKDHIIMPKEHSRFLANLKNDYKNFYWLAKDKNNGKYLGVIYLNRVDFKNKNAYLGIYNNPDIKLGGLGNILIKCLKKIAFDITELHTLKLEVTQDNVGAINFYEKWGFLKEGQLKQFVLKDKRWRDVIIMGTVSLKTFK